MTQILKPGASSCRKNQTNPNSKMKPSPLMKLVPANDSPERLKSEIDIIDMLSYCKALFNHFQGTKKMELVDIIGLNTPNHHPFDCLNKSNEAELKQMRDIGRRVYCNAILPFSSKRMNSERMEGVVRGFEPYFNHTVKGWTGGAAPKPAVFEMVHRVVYNDILHCGGNKDRCALLVTLMVEALAISNYMLSPSHFRVKFWSISFLYSILGGRRWDTLPENQWPSEATEARSILDGDRADAYMKTGFSIVRISSWDACLSRLRMLTEHPSNDDDERLHLNACITNLLSIDSIGCINITPDREAQISVAISNARDLIQACETIASMSQVAWPADDEDAQPAAPVAPPPEENAAAAGWIDEQVARLFVRQEDGVDVVQNYADDEDAVGEANRSFSHITKN